MSFRCRRRAILFASIIAVLAALPALRAQDNMRLAPYNGYTSAPFDTTASAYDYLVDSSLPQDEPDQKKFKTVQAAYAAAPAGTADKPTVIGIKPDVYFLRGGDTEASMIITKSYITLLGLTDDRRKVVLADNRGNKEGASNNGYILMVNATGFTMMNLTLVNYCNLDYEYPGDASKNLKMRSPVITQAVALQADGDKHFYSHVAFLGRLDTLFIRTTRSYFTNVYVEGTDDFIGGGTVGVWENSEVYFPTGNGVMSSSGIAFINTVFRAERGLEFYKGFRSPVALIRCTMPVNTPKSPVAWMVWKAAVRQNVYSLTYQTKDASGKPAVIHDSIVGPPAFSLSREISADEAKAFNPWNMLRATPTGQVDDWDPAGVRAKYENDGDGVFRMGLSAAFFPAPGAKPASTAAAAAPGGSGTAPSARPGTAALGDPFANSEPPGNANLRTGGPGVMMTAGVQPLRATGAEVTWSTPSKLLSLNTTTGRVITVTGNNTTNHAEYATVKATAPNGFYVTSHIYVEPAYIDPPTFTRAPALAAPVNGKIAVNYSLNLGGRDDQSIIDWSLCADAQCAARREIAVSRGNEPLRQLTITPGFVGKYVEASIQPKHNISDPGPATTAVATKPIAATDIRTTTIDPNFRNLPETATADFASGNWTALGNWTSSVGDNLVNGYGLRVASQGSQLLFDNEASTSNMSVKVVLTPEKTAGQGFGIAGSPDDSAGERNQKADIFIKYDPRTKNGYSLRFWRTIQSAEKCMFQLYQIVDGIGHPINEQQQLTGVFKPNTTITLSITGSTFTATGSNSTDGDTLALKGTITPNAFGGAGVAWTGSVPFGNSVVISQFKISY